MLIGICVIASATAAAAGGQNSVMRADIPFPFVAGDEVVPAGIYFVTVDEDFLRVKFNSLQDTRIRAVRLSPGTSNRKSAASEPGTLTFYKYGEHYVLRTVWRPGETLGHNLPQSRTERELAKRYSPGEIASFAISPK